MVDFKSCFDEQRIVQRLCTLRLEAARKRRREQFLANLTNTLDGCLRAEVCRLLPPRSQWSSCRPDLDRRKDPSRTNVEFLKAGLVHHVMRELRRPDTPYKWLGRLRAFLSEVRETAFAWNGDELRPSSILPIPKGQAGSGQKYRILAVYDLKNRMLMAGFSSYLRQLIDPILKPECIAFRQPQPGQPPITHHEAVARIQKLRGLFDSSESIWVAECDIQGFFDAVSHKIAEQSVETALAAAETEADPRLHSFLGSFLSGYRFVNGATSIAKAKLSVAVHRPPLRSERAAREQAAC